MSRKTKVADFFLQAENPYSQKRAINAKNVMAVFGVLVVLVLIFGSYLDSRAEAKRVESAAKKQVQEKSLTNQTAVQEAALRSDQDHGYLDLHIDRPKQTQTRQLSASQIIKRTGDSGDAIPMGAQIRARLSLKVESTDADSPVSALVIQNAQSPAGADVIPVDAKLIGQGRLDTARERLQVSFHTVVFPDGEQFSISGLAQMTDGSSGLVGNFSSGAFKHHASQFLGTFINGMAEGLKDRTTGGGLGIPFEPGGVKNGLLNGAAQSSLNYAHSSSEEMNQVQASISVESGVEFLVYLQQGFHQ